MDPNSIHIIGDFFHCPQGALEKCRSGEEILADTVKRSGLHAILIKSHQFDPTGYTAVAMLTESHITLHTWPEHGTVLVDVFTCGDPRAAEKAFILLEEHFKPELSEKTIMHRGGSFFPAEPTA